jgi:hypothetical protein
MDDTCFECGCPMGMHDIEWGRGGTYARCENCLSDCRVDKPSERISNEE